MKVTATRDGAAWRLTVGEASESGFALVSEAPAVFRRMVGGARQEVRTFDPMQAGKALSVRDVTPPGLFPQTAPAKRRRRA